MKNNFIKRKKTGQEEIEILDIAEAEVVISDTVENISDSLFSEYESKVRKIIKDKISYEMAIEIMKTGKDKDIEFLLYCMEKSIKESKTSVGAYFNKIVNHPNMATEFKESKEKKAKKTSKKVEDVYYEKEKVVINSIEDYAKSVGKEVEDLSTLDLRIYKSLSSKK